MQLADFDAVNEAVNAATTYAMPDGTYHWENSDEQGLRGMCADQAIAKYERLIKAGCPKENLRFAIVGVEQPGDHMILCARDDAGTWWALDIRYPRVMRPDLLPYTWQKWGVGPDPGDWTEVRLADGPDRGENHAT